RCRARDPVHESLFRDAIRMLEPANRSLLLTGPGFHGGGLLAGPTGRATVRQTEDGYGVGTAFAAVSRHPGSRTAPSRCRRFLLAARDPHASLEPLASSVRHGGL